MCERMWSIFFFKIFFRIFSLSYIIIPIYTSGLLYAHGSDCDDYDDDDYSC